MALSAAAVLLGALSLWLYVSGQPPADDSAEAGFARDMSVHHAQAVEMAEIVRDKTESDEIRVLASDVALTQQGQIGQMQGWLDVWGLPATGTEPAMAWMGMPTQGRMPGMASPEEIGRLNDSPPAEADRLFLRLMIPHHRASLGMTQAVLDETDRPEVGELARAIQASQKAEIATMEDMLRARGGEAPVGGPGEGAEPMPGMGHGK
ncbi:DUF305 domain-containing protein (plasmid) [Rubrobacter tropicus]|uniref:DUF305 domain-containing protein n=1 Tax=Rubrobacter tropicus TaxID=2653851 RepID=A0A6G8QGD4_9ACTN|nr:DUF305 domain-containing protein [Rubrobacter tropicus]